MRVCMEVNSTLFIQIFNFGIAYFCIRYLLLKPAVALILAEREKQHLLTKTIDQHRAQLAHEEQRKKEEWAAWQKEFATHAPRACTTTTQRITMLSTTHQKPSETDIKKAADDIAASLFLRVNHVQ